MTITINATPADSTANSYVTLAEANTYMEAHLQASIWSALDDEKKKAALVAATRLLDTEQFAGRRSHQQQSLSWPRTYVYDYDAYPVEGVPQKLKAAQIEYAIWNLTEEDRLAGSFELETMESVEIGPIKYKIRNGASTTPDFIEDLLEAIGPEVFKDSGKPTSKVMVQ